MVEKKFPEQSFDDLFPNNISWTNSFVAENEMVGLEQPTITPCVVMESNEEFSNQVTGSPVDESVSPSASTQFPRDVTCIMDSPEESCDQEAGSSVAESPLCPGPSQLPSVVTPSVSPPEHEGELNYISKYLIQYVPVKKGTYHRKACDWCQSFD